MKQGMQTRKGIFGKVIAWGDAAEEQGRKTLHSHMMLFIEHFDRLVTMLWSEDPKIKNAIEEEILFYFEKAMSSSYEIFPQTFTHRSRTAYGTENINDTRTDGTVEESISEPDEQLIQDITGHAIAKPQRSTAESTHQWEVEPIQNNSFLTDSNCNDNMKHSFSQQEIHPLQCNGSLVEVPKQNLRDMRHKTQARKYNGIVTRCTKCNQVFTTRQMVWNAIKTWYRIAVKEFPNYFHSNISFPMTNEQIHIISLRFSYDMNRLYPGTLNLKKSLWPLPKFDLMNMTGNTNRAVSTKVMNVGITFLNLLVKCLTLYLGMILMKQHGMLFMEKEITSRHAHFQ